MNTGNNDDDATIGAIVFFTISGVILLITLITLLFAFKTEYFRYYLGKTKDFNQNNIEQVENEIANQPITTTSTASQNEALIENEKVKEPEIPKEEEITFWKLFKRLYEIDLLSCFIYIITFALFPAVSISQRLFKTGKYRQITIITIYNVGDTIGRAIMSKINFKKCLAYIIITRTKYVMRQINYFEFQNSLGDNFFLNRTPN